MTPTAKRWSLIVGKLAVAALIYWLIFRKVTARDNVDELWTHLAGMSWGWVGVGVLSLCCAIACSVVRWQRLLVGQGIHAPYRHLVGSFMVGRFFGAVAPGGFTGLNGYRIYDIATHTGKTARAVASIGIEMVLGNLAMGIVAFVACFFGYRYVGLTGMLLLLTVFSGLIGVALALLIKPTLVRRLSSMLPPAVRQRLQSMVDAVCAYEGKGALLASAAALGCGTHVFNSLIYVCAARALHVELSAGEVFFVSTLQILTTLAPISINGVGLREATAIGLYSVVGLPTALGFLIPNVGFVLVEMTVSSLGGLVLLARGAGYRPQIHVDDAEHERTLAAAIEHVPEDQWPRVGRGASVGLGAGLVGGLLVGMGDAVATVATAGGAAEADVWFYGACTYGLFCGAAGLVSGAALAQSGRWLKRAALPEPDAFAHLAGLCVAGMSFVLGVFRVRRDVFHEELVWMSGPGLGVLAACALGAALLYGALFLALRWLCRRRPASGLLYVPGSVGLALGAAAITFAVTAMEQPASAAQSHTADRVQGHGGNLLFIVVDTLRADHLPAYGYKEIETPALDAFAADAVRFENAFANSSWTRPSFASLLTGRYASNHGVMSKASSLPDDVVSLAEQFRDAGYATKGVVTNVNVSPFFNFHQGFDEYTYLAPKNVLGASDSASRMLLPQVLRKVVERLRALRGQTLPGYAYHDARAVNEQVFEWLDRAPAKPWMMFVGYMDPHDPYFEHPYNGVGYARAAHERPAPEEAARLRALYDGEIEFWDEHFGALVQELKRRGLYDDLTIVLTSDHGEEFMDHGAFWHGTTLYDEQLRVPLFLKVPGNRDGGSVRRQWVQSVDLMPSLLRLHKLPVPEGVQGGDILLGSRQVFAEESHERNVLRALRTQKGGAELKLILANRGNPRGLAEEELYVMGRDPREQHNLAAKDPARVAELRAELEAAEARAKTGAAARREVDGQQDEVLRERLKNLGYIEE